MLCPCEVQWQKNSFPTIIVSTSACVSNVKYRWSLSKASFFPKLILRSAGSAERTSKKGCVRWWVSPLGCKKQAGRFCDQADLKRYSRLKNQSASIDASGPAGFFFVSEHAKEKIRGVRGKQAEPGVASGFLIHRTPPNIKTGKTEILAPVFRACGPLFGNFSGRSVKCTYFMTFNYLRAHHPISKGQSLFSSFINISLKQPEEREHLI